MIFIGPCVTQVVKHGTCDDVNVLLNELMFNSFDYAFLCVSNNTTGKQDTGSHWSLMFVDISGSSVYHLDSLHGTNTLAAKTVTRKLGFKENSFHELSCTQQNNNYECGLSVLVNVKFINEGSAERLYLSLDARSLIGTLCLVTALEAFWLQISRRWFHQSQPLYSRVMILTFYQPMSMQLMITRA